MSIKSTANDFMTNREQFKEDSSVPYLVQLRRVPGTCGNYATLLLLWVTHGSWGAHTHTHFKRFWCRQVGMCARTYK